ncbi:MAG: hypothetical protein L6N96_01265 [Candidatus Methylarchaceae archaeon HK02M2]|nr:hypothetical protein [Candidatus Methylarchaceae archaeon HK02M2]
MTSFERFFASLKYWLDIPKAYDRWPKFESFFDQKEYLFIEMKGEKVLLLNCGDCDGPSDVLHPICKKCIDFRTKLAERETNSESNIWNHLILARIYTKTDNIDL